MRESYGRPAGPPLRYRRLRGGYRREDVDETLSELRLDLRSLEEDVDALRTRTAELERELEEARAELDAYREREGEIEQAVEAAGRALDRASRIDALAHERTSAVAQAASSLRQALGDLEQALSQLLPAGEEAEERPVE